MEANVRSVIRSDQLLMSLIVRTLGIQAYDSTWQAMKTFTEQRQVTTEDELWLLEHPPVFTLGQAGKEEHILQNTQEIPVIKVDRGGQVTYHGPGQLVAYTLIDLTRKKITIHQWVHFLENIVIQFLQAFHISGERHQGAPGIYVEGKKIGSIGLRVRRGCTYHGLALNIDADLQPFSYINPCGFKNLKMTNLTDFIKIKKTVNDIIPLFTKIFRESMHE